MKMKFKNNVLKTLKFETVEYKVDYLMKGYNVWHNDGTFPKFELALERCKYLEKQCKCYTEIREINKITSIIRRYDILK